MRGTAIDQYVYEYGFSNETEIENTKIAMRVNKIRKDKENGYTIRNDKRNSRTV